MGKGRRSNGNSGTATLTQQLVIKMANGVCYDPQRGNCPRNVGIFPSGREIRINNHGGTVVVAGRTLGAYESVDAPTGTRVQINGQTGRVVRA